ncbi:hypothetical protein, partial [Streptomyces prunicolor]|uniref:hypothetical protein n=1 Tax=Streptomyces prunicolor TaxID=67348 RepID=UPI003406DC6D
QDLLETSSDEFDALFNTILINVTSFFRDPDALSKQARSRPGSAGAPWGVSLGDRVGVARSYLTPDAQWHTIWRTLANPGE